MSSSIFDPFEYSNMGGIKGIDEAISTYLKEQKDLLEEISRNIQNAETHKEMRKNANWFVTFYDLGRHRITYFQTAEDALHFMDQDLQVIQNGMMGKIR